MISRKGAKRLSINLATSTGVTLEIKFRAGRPVAFVTDGGSFEAGLYFGAIDLATGAMRPGRSTMSDSTSLLLARFNADPLAVAVECGHLTGRCCFCNLPLTDDRSVTLGYGQTCAKKFELPWSKKACAIEVAA